VPRFLLALLLILLFGYCLSWIFATVGLVVGNPETAQAAAFPILAPLVFASSAFVPVASMPDWLQVVAKVSPVTLTANTARGYALVGGVPASLGGAAAWIIGLLVIFIPLCVWRYRRMN
jgi:ABC-type multidrug transport system permease subunit